ncbi:MAG: triose-phosphate isomerase [Phycisphaerae bacterium]|nr:triose-phosphate isomerase [Phycisphaerae bacterium]
MSRKLFIAGNWKMNLSRARSSDLAAALVEEIGKEAAVDTAVCPPSCYLMTVQQALGVSRIDLGAQNMWYEDQGAYTGEISADMLVDVGCKYVICGHSERRHVIGESDEVINRKVLKALSEGLNPILCVGELLEQRDGGQTMEVIRQQVTRDLEGVGASYAGGTTLADRLTIAYEPVWAIGTGRTATPDQAQEVHAAVRTLIGELYDETLAAELRIQYGGSVKPDNAAALLARPDIDGALVGGASLKAPDFAAIVRAGVELSD